MAAMCFRTFTFSDAATNSTHTNTQVNGNYLAHTALLHRRFVAMAVGFAPL